MASKAVIDAVAARMGVTWNGIVVIGPNETDRPPRDGAPFIMLQFPVSNTERLPVTRRLYREEGGFRVVLHTARGVGLADHLTQLDALAELFRDRRFDGLETRVPSAPYIDDEDGNYVIGAIAVPYVHQFEG